LAGSAVMVGEYRVLMFFLMKDEFFFTHSQMRSC